MKKLLFILVQIWISSVVCAQTIPEIFPNLSKLDKVSYRTSGPHDSFPENTQKLPDVNKWIERLKKAKQSDLGYEVWIYSKAGQVLFIWERYKNHGAIYQISDNEIAKVVTSKDGKSLHTNQLGIGRFVWRYDIHGKLIETDSFRWQFMSGGKSDWVSTKKRIYQLKKQTEQDVAPDGE